jgi:hypothetical protein
LRLWLQLRLLILSVAEEVFVNFYNFNHIVKKFNFQGILLPQPELQPKFGFAALWSRSRKKYFGSATLAKSIDETLR